MYIVSVSKKDKIILLEKVKTEIAMGRGVVLKKKLYLQYEQLWKDLPRDIKSEWRNISDERQVSAKDFM